MWPSGALTAVGGWSILPLLLLLLRHTAGAGTGADAIGNGGARRNWYDGIDGVKVLSPGDVSQKVVDDIFHRQRDAQFGESRVALLLTPGTYPEDFNITVGYYTSVIGVGRDPSIVRLNSVASHNGANGHATNNFWRSFEGLSLRAPTITWAASQGSPIRRSVIEGDLRLSERDGFSSGGFIADAKVMRKLDLGSQQQWLFRNTDLMGEVACPGGWNYVFVGVRGPSADAMAGCGAGAEGKVSVTAQTPRIAEKPFLVREEDGHTWHIYVPRYYDRQTTGATVKYADAIARKLSMKADVFVATADLSAAEINRGIQGMKGLLLTPGIYRLAEPIQVRTDNFVVLGIGFPTLVATWGKPAVQVREGLQDVRLAGVLLEAGTPKAEAETSPLLQWGDRRPPPADEQFKRRRRLRAEGAAAGVLSDVFVRVGSFKYQGCPVVQADTMVEINSDDVVLDHVWLWHADHDDCGQQQEAGVSAHSDRCQSKHGLLVNGHGVTSYGLAAEHIMAGHNVLWNGEDGEAYFYQAELPYHNKEFGIRGYAGYAVAPSVQAHSASGLGVYIIGRELEVRSAFVFPELIQAQNLVSVVIGGDNKQFQNIACLRGPPGADGERRCFKPQSCRGIRCVLDRVPGGAPRHAAAEAGQRHSVGPAVPAPDDEVQLLMRGPGVEPLSGAPVERKGEDDHREGAHGRHSGGGHGCGGDGDGSSSCEGERDSGLPTMQLLFCSFLIFFVFFLVIGFVCYDPILAALNRLLAAHGLELDEHGCAATFPWLPEGLLATLETSSRTDCRTTRPTPWASL